MVTKSFFSKDGGNISFAMGSIMKRSESAYNVLSFDSTV